MRRPPHVADEDGFSLAELLVTIVLVGVTFVAILTGLMTTIEVSAYAPDAGDDRRRCAFGGGMGERQSRTTRTARRATAPGMYSLSGLPVPSGYSAAITRSRITGTALRSRRERTACPHISVPSCTGGDKGLQRITIVATSSERAGDRDGPGHEEGDLMNVRDEKGQALILALAFLMFFGLVIGVMLSLAERERPVTRASSASSDRRSTRRTAPPTPPIQSR